MSGERPLRLLISAGPTREPIDAVRFISNYSTGYMGSQLALEGAIRGHSVTVVCGPCMEAFPASVRLIPVEQAEQMEQALRRQSAHADVILMAAAVSDFRVAKRLKAKVPRSAARHLDLVPTPDIIGRLPRKAHQIVVGFALESGQVLERAKRKLANKGLDLLLAQQLERDRSSGKSRHSVMAPFGRRPVRAWLLSPGKTAEPLGKISKRKAARVLLDKIEALWYGQHIPLISGGKV